jgi:thermitase
MNATVGTQHENPLPPAANLFFKTIFLLDEARSVATGDGIVTFGRVFPSPARLAAFSKGELDKKIDDESSIKESYENMIPEEQKLHRCFQVVFKTLEMRNAFIHKYKNHDALESVMEEVEGTLFGFQIPPNDPMNNQLWGHQKTNVEAVWDCSRGCGQVVAIVDSGIDLTHQDLQLQLWESSPGHYGYNVLTVGTTPPTDTLGHGTHVAGIVAARGNNNFGVIGIAPAAQLMAIKICVGTSISSSMAANGIHWAAQHGADVINCSWGFTMPPPIFIYVAIGYALAQQQQPVIVAAAGNAGIDAINFYPASDPRVICVAATDITDARAIFSNWGSVVEVAAPGVNILSTVPISVYSSGFMNMSGTSMAAPHVSAMVAIIRSRLSGLTQSEYLEIVQTYVSTIYPDRYIGTGRIDFTFLKEILCGCGCSPCRYRVILEERRLYYARIRKKFTIAGNSNLPACTSLPCTPVDIPRLAPCFKLHWGDSLLDQIETHDTEIIYITACNPYCNVTFKGLKIIAIKIIPNYVLPNNEMAVELAASSLICYGTLGPSRCTTREYALITNNTTPGTCTLEFEYCIEEIEFHEYNRGKNSFTLTLVNS